MFEVFSMPIKESDFNALCREYANEDEAYLGYMLANGFKSSEKANSSKAA